MSRTRMVKPALFSDEKIAKVSIPARYLFVGLLTEADDQGVLHNNAAKIAGNLFPLENLSPRKVRKWLEELEAVGLIVAYEAKDTPCLYVRGFNKHQKVSHPTPSSLPNPPEMLRNGSGKFPPQRGLGVGGGLGGGVGVGGEAKGADEERLPNPDDQQRYLLDRLQAEVGEQWDRFADADLISLSRGYGSEPVREALREAWQRRESPTDSVGWVISFCRQEASA